MSPSGFAAEHRKLGALALDNRRDFDGVLRPRDAMIVTYLPEMRGVLNESRPRRALGRDVGGRGPGGRI